MLVELLAVEMPWGAWLVVPGAARAWLSISPDPSPLIIGQGAPRWHLRFRDHRTSRSYNLAGATVSGTLGGKTLTGAFALESPGAGTVTYTPVAADLPTVPGQYDLQLKATISGLVTVITEALRVDVQAAQ